MDSRQNKIKTVYLTKVIEFISDYEFSTKIFAHFSKKKYGHCIII